MRNAIKKSMVTYYEEFGDCDACGALVSMYLVPEFKRKRCSVCGVLKNSSTKDKTRLVHEASSNDIINTQRG